jgi:hypothetical protein
MTTKADVLRLLEKCSQEERREIFTQLRSEFPIHRLEADLNTTAEVILEAVFRSPDLTQRGVKGVIAEAVFLVKVLQRLPDWTVIDFVSGNSYDFLVEDMRGTLSIQVKMQRRLQGKPYVRQGKFVVETQRTRTGKDAAGVATRPYRFGDFDVLAVSMHASTGDWTKFMYTVGSWLLPRPHDGNLIAVLQPVAMVPNDDWTDDLQECIDWFRSGIKRTIKGF